MCYNENCKMSQKHLNIFIIVLLLVAISLGVVIFKKENPDFSLNFWSGESDNVSESELNNSNSGSAINPDDIEIESMEDAIEEVLQSPGQDATQEERQRHYALAVKIAKDTTTVDITGCEADPTVTRISMGDTLNIVNDDNSPHSFVFGGGNTVSVPAGGSKSVNVGEPVFQHDAGLYGFGCDASSRGIGYILVTPSS